MNTSHTIYIIASMFAVLNLSCETENKLKYPLNACFRHVDCSDLTFEEVYIFDYIYQPRDAPVIRPTSYEVVSESTLRVGMGAKQSAQLVGRDLVFKSDEGEDLGLFEPCECPAEWIGMNIDRYYDIIPGHYPDTLYFEKKLQMLDSLCPPY